MCLIADQPIRGYARYIRHEWTELRDGHMRTIYIYEVPDNLADDMIAKGARVDK